MAKLKKAAKKRALTLLACSATLALGVSAFSAPISVFAAAVSGGTLTKYYTDYGSLEETIAAAEKHTEQTVAEGATLLKNKDNALPMSGTASVSVLGVSADALIGAAATSGQSTESAGGDTVAEVLADAGFNVNPTLKAYYDTKGATIGQEEVNFNGQVKNSFRMYNDAAVVVLSRTGGEGSDAARVTSEKAGTNLLGEEDTASHVALAQDAPSAEGAQAEGNTYKHYLMLTESERELLKLAEKNFKKVIVVLNTSNAMEIEELNEWDGIDAIINIDRPGEGGLAALPKILNGEVNPSGGLVDEWYSDFTADPTWYNFGNNNQSRAYAAGQNDYMNSEGKTDGKLESGQDVIGDTEGFHGVDYEEGIYLGYKYYETYYTDMYKLNPEAAQQWWEDNVTYAFGYGLSYTTFSFKSNGIYTDAKLKNALPQTGVADLFKSTKSTAAQVKKLYVPVTVTNTGSVAGKKTVQIYVTAPYDDTSKVEKSAVSLVGYAKTDELQPGKSQTVVVEINVQDMASWYSYYTQEDKTSGAYIMEDGEYTLRIMEDSHYDCATVYNAEKGIYEVNGVEECYAQETFSLDKDIALEQDDYSGLQVSSLFTDGLNDNGDGADADTKVGDSNFGNVRTADMMAEGGTGMTTMSRNGTVSATNKSVSANVLNYSGVGVPTKPEEVTEQVNGFDVSFPEAPKTSDLTFKDNVLDNWSFWDNYSVSSTYSGANDATGNYSKYYVNDDNKGYVWSHTSVPQGWTQSKGTLTQYVNEGANGDKGHQNIWLYVSDSNSIKFADMAGVPYDDERWDAFLNQLTYDELCYVNTYCGYGTGNINSIDKGLTVDRDGPNSINLEFQMAAESLLAATWNTELAEERGILIANIALLTGFQGWYAPGADIHRSPFSGRNNEYFSQDGILGGYIGAALTQGVQSRGVICYTKHILMNDQETDRGCLFTWCDEQAMRENYIKNFQMILQEGGSKAGMTAYGRIAGLSNTNNTNLSIELYQNEWGSQAYFVTDGYIGWNQRTNPDMMVRAGNQTILTTGNTEYLSGQTNPETGAATTGGFYKVGETLPDGTTAAKEGVYIAQAGENGATVYEISYTQWYCVRQMAHGVLYQVANTAGQYNGYSNLTVEGTKLEATEGVSAELSVKIDSLVDSDSFVTYSATGLPEGLSIDANTGAISGTPKAPGNYIINVNYVIDGWVEKSATYTLEVTSAITLTAESDDLAAAKAGEDFFAELTSSVYTSADYDSLVYSIEGGALPEGLTLSESGVIEGTPTEAGTFTFTVRLTAKNSSSGGSDDKGGKGKGNSGNSSKTVEHTFTIVVAGGEEVPEITVDDLQDKIDDLEGTIKDLEDTITELQGTVSNISPQPEEQSSGCSGTLEGMYMVGALAAAAAVYGAVIVIKNRKREDK
ncbi:MAG: glycoside hydrolase family 3 C-terminal domain-containing protein [Candidatus Coproplasma sp.]